MSKIESRPAERSGKRFAAAALGICAVGIVLLAALLVPADPASAETPAERCARETAAYNSAWAQSWAATNGRPASEAPPPPVPYVCHDPGPTTTTTSQPPVVTAPTVPSDTNTPDSGGPDMGAHAPTDLPTASPGRSPIVPIPDSGPRQQRVPREDSRAIAVTIPTALAGQDVVLRFPAGVRETAYRVQQSGGIQRVSIARLGQQAPDRIALKAEIPAGTYWKSLNEDNLALMAPGDLVIATLFSAAKGGFDLVANGTDLVATFMRQSRSVPSVADILAPARVPASASGCTMANGQFFSRNCISVRGEGQHIDYIVATLDTGGSPYPRNICNRGYEFNYTDEFGNPRSQVIEKPGCTWMAAGVTWSEKLDVNRNAKDGSQVCTRTRSSHSNGEWSPYACVTIEK